MDYESNMPEIGQNKAKKVKKRQKNGKMKQSFKKQSFKKLRVRKIYFAVLAVGDWGGSSRPTVLPLWFSLKLEL